MKKLFLRTSLFTLILLLFLVNSANNVISISGVNSNNTAFVNNNNSNNTNLDISNLVYDIDSNPFNVSYADLDREMVAMDIFHTLG